MLGTPVNYHLGKFPPNDLDLNRLVPFIGPATIALGRYDGLLSAIPNKHVLLSPLTTQEAVLSSKIEGTRVTMGEVLAIEAGGESEALTQPKRDDAEEVLNYRTAMLACTRDIRDRPFSQQILRAAHGVLMRGVRGRDKAPGQYRTEQNWIGTRGGEIKDASFVPIAPEHLQGGMDDWERYLNRTDVCDPLVQLAVMHVEFEALHPFKDGNGRLGRMLIPLFLFQRGLLASPDFYMSGYLEENRDAYQDHLRAVSREDAWTEWCIFFLRGITDQAVSNEMKARSILALYERLKTQVVDVTHSQHAIRAVDFIFNTPIFTTSTFIRRSDIPKPTANRILTLLREEGLLVAVREGSGRRPALYCFPELLNIAEGQKVL